MEDFDLIEVVKELSFELVVIGGGLSFSSEKVDEFSVGNECWFQPAWYFHVVACFFYLRP